MKSTSYHFDVNTLPGYIEAFINSSGCLMVFMQLVINVRHADILFLFRVLKHKHVFSIGTPERSNIHIL